MSPNYEFIEFHYLGYSNNNSVLLDDFTRLVLAHEGLHSNGCTVWWQEQRQCYASVRFLAPTASSNV